MLESNAVMLPRNVRPVSYAISLEPSFDDFTFKGEETINVELLEPTDSITLNSIEIDVKFCEVMTGGAGVHDPAETTFDEEAETVTFRFNETLPAGAARLEIGFTGELNDKLRGFYRSSYKNEAGEERYLATTQLEATDARRAFPCWDEPPLKATFTLTLTIPEEMVAVSNMLPGSESVGSGGKKTVSFGTTPLMSTYLLAFIIGDLASIEQRAANGTLIRVWTTRGKEEQGRYALDVSLKLLDYFNDYFGIPYPLEKLDHIAIPDFAAGAMENWGAITYREVALLIDPESSSAMARELVASIIAHEMAHMWFGDLVTMAWWDDLWLNESFASWMGDKAVDHLFPEWEMWTQFVSSDTNRALSLDGLANSHPIEQAVENPAQIGELFDAISYSKGGSVLRMLHHFLGEEPFRTGLQSYLDQHKYDNARQRDLWDALGEASDQPVADMMHSWVNQTGYPVVEVETERSENAVVVSAKQRRFLYEHLLDPAETDDTKWRVPLSAITPTSVRPESTLMDGPSSALHLGLTSGDDSEGWVKMNPGQTGFYRVNYCAEDWDRLRPAIENAELPPVDRLGLQNDAYALARAGYLPVNQFLSLAEAYVNEENATVWEDLSTNLGGLDALIESEAFYEDFEAFGRRLFSPVAGRMGWDAKDGEAHLDALMRSTVLSALGNYGDEATLDEADKRFADYQADAANVHPDIRRVVLSLTAKRGDRGKYDAIWDLQKKATLEEEKMRLLSALTGFETPDLLQETLERSLKPEDVRTHDTIRVVSGVAVNRYGRDMAWEFLKENWPEFDRRYGEGGFALMSVVSFTARFTTQDKMEDVERFFKDNPAPAAERTIRQSLERIRLNIAWLEKSRADLASWLAG